MHILAMPYADQLSAHAREIELRALRSDWEHDTPIRLEISIVFSAVIIRKLWEHYAGLFRETGFSLDDLLQGFFERGSGKQETGLTFVNRIIHSKMIDTSEATKFSGIEFQSDKRGKLRIPYADVVAFFEAASKACREMHG